MPYLPGSAVPKTATQYSARKARAGRAIRAFQRPCGELAVRTCGREMLPDTAGSRGCPTPYLESTLRYFPRVPNLVPISGRVVAQKRKAGAPNAVPIPPCVPSLPRALHAAARCIPPRSNARGVSWIGGSAGLVVFPDRGFSCCWQSADRKSPSLRYAILGLVAARSLTNITRRRLRTAARPLAGANASPVPSTLSAHPRGSAILAARALCVSHSHFAIRSTAHAAEARACVRAAACSLSRSQSGRRSDSPLSRSLEDAAPRTCKPSRLA